MRLPQFVLPTLLLAGLVIFAMENWSPVVPLVILGQTTVALPLGMWAIAACLLGSITTLAIALSLSLLSRRIAPATDPRRPQQSPSPDPSSSRGESYAQSHNGEGRQATQRHSASHAPSTSTYGEERRGGEQPRSRRVVSQPSQPREEINRKRESEVSSIPSSLEDWEEFSRPRSSWEEWSQGDSRNSPTSTSEYQSDKPSSSKTSGSSNWFKRQDNRDPVVTEVGFDTSPRSASRFASREDLADDRDAGRTQGTYRGDRPETFGDGYSPDEDPSYETGGYPNSYSGSTNRSSPSRARVDSRYTSPPSGYVPAYPEEDENQYPHDYQAYYQTDSERQYRENYPIGDYPNDYPASRTYEQEDDPYDSSHYGASSRREWQDQAYYDNLQDPSDRDFRYEGGEYQDYSDDPYEDSVPYDAPPYDDSFDASEQEYSSSWRSPPSPPEHDSEVGQVSAPEQFIVDYGDEAALDAFDETLDSSDKGRYRWQPSNPTTAPSSPEQAPAEEGAVWDDWVEDNDETPSRPSNSSSINSPEPDAPRPIREIQRPPIVSQQSGSVYSYRYRREDGGGTEPKSSESSPPESPIEENSPKSTTDPS